MSNNKIWRVSVYEYDSDLGKLWEQEFFHTEKQAKDNLVMRVGDNNKRNDKCRQYEAWSDHRFTIGFYCPCFNTFMGLDTITINYEK